MSDIIKIAAIAVVAALCSTVIRKHVPEIALVLTLMAGLLILWMIFSSLTYVLEFMKDLGEMAGLSSAVLMPVLKVIGISLITHTSSQLCKDVNESGLASFLEFSGTVGALIVTIPLMRAVLHTISALI